MAQSRTRPTITAAHILHFCGTPVIHGMMSTIAKPRLPRLGIVRLPVPAPVATPSGEIEVLRPILLAVSSRRRFRDADAHDVRAGRQLLRLRAVDS